MPSIDQHVTKAEANYAFAQSINLESQAEIGWALVVIFYAAVHYIEAYFATSERHLRSHPTRDSLVGKDVNLKSIFHEYQELKYYGYNARYEMTEFTVQDFRTEAISNFVKIRDLITPLL